MEKYIGILSSVRARYTRRLRARPFFKGKASGLDLRDCRRDFLVSFRDSFRFILVSFLGGTFD